MRAAPRYPLPMRAFSTHAEVRSPDHDPHRRETRGAARFAAAFALLAACHGSPSPSDVTDVLDGSDVPDTMRSGDAREIASADVAPGGPCTFNRDCIAEERCACTDSTCRCEAGARGSGRNGVDTCGSGDDCESAICVEGPGGVYYCSDTCASPADCAPMLPACTSIATLGSICVRDPSSGADAGGDAAIPGCEGVCATTLLHSMFGSNTGDFDRAQHGTSGTDGIYVEAHYGGDPACPDMSSPSPDRTLVINGLRAGPVGSVQTEADGVTASLLDFTGQLTSSPVVHATSIRATARYVARGESVSYSIEATFSEGTIVGGLFAPHCASLDAP
jgi:hypothetical protein